MASGFCCLGVSTLTRPVHCQVIELRSRAQNLPDDYLVVLIGDLITEEALPTYMAMLNTLDGVRDETGAAPTPWARCVASSCHGLLNCPRCVASATRPQAGLGVQSAC